jgi:hypothetical protein
MKQTKQQVDRYNRYRDYVKRYGCRYLYQHYDTYSNRKAAAWQKIFGRKCDEDGFCFTIVGGGSHYFSTGYLRKVDDHIELVYDWAWGIDRIPLTDEQRLELSRILCLEI